ncbi:MAG TPA: aldehyde dehydrogenase family protein [bacterium]|nr:aldehyde dehydrogenase family protein [bacterium]
MLPQPRLLIGGQWVDAASGKTFETVNPANEEVTAKLAEAGVEDVNRAVAAARKAFDEGPWPKMPAVERGKVLKRVADLIRKNLQEFADLETADTGKTLFDSGKIEVPLAAELYEYYGGWADKVYGETVPMKANALGFTLREPVGVVGLITPWNFPLLLESWKVSAALAMGNTCVLKPAQLTPLTALKLGEVCLEAGLPEGVLNVIPGPGRAVGDALVKHAGVDKIAFTGSTEVGKGVLKAAADSVKRVTVELGGKSPNIVFADADLEAAIRGALTGIFYNKGEVCAAGSRIFIEKSVYDQVAEGIAKKAAALTIGDPRDKGTRMGPVISKAQMETVLAYIESGKKDGAKVLAGGAKGPQAKGFFVQPTVFGNATNDMKIAREEIFGPVMNILRFKDINEVVQRGNQTFYGLAAAVWTRDISKAHRLANSLRAGTVWINCYDVFDAAAPFGGFKQSGFGRELGRIGLDAYTEAKSVWVDLA